MEISTDRQPRRARPVYLNEEEVVCIDNAAKALGVQRGPWLRSLALFRSSWRGYSGPLFDLGADVSELQRIQGADCLYDNLRSLREIAKTCSYLYNRQHVTPDAHLLRMMIAYCKMVATFSDVLPELRRIDEAIELAFDLEALATRIYKHNPITADQLTATAELLSAALQPREPTDGTQ